MFNFRLKSELSQTAHHPRTNGFVNRRNVGNMFGDDENAVFAFRNGALKQYFSYYRPLFVVISVRSYSKHYGLSNTFVAYEVAYLNKIYHCAKPGRKAKISSHTNELIHYGEDRVDAIWAAAISLYKNIFRFANTFYLVFSEKCAIRMPYVTKVRERGHDIRLIQ